MDHAVVGGDILEQKVDAIVNAWHPNNTRRWRLDRRGAIKRHPGLWPFRELSRARPLLLGMGALTGAGPLNYAGIIHVAGQSLLCRATGFSIRKSVTSAIPLAPERGFSSIALPIIGTRSGAFGEKERWG